MADLSALRDRLLARYDLVGQAAAQTVRAAVAAASPVLTGATRDSVDVRQDSTAPLVQWTVFATTPQAEFTEMGTRPHIIHPVKGKFLRFESGGEVVFARVVNHPGTQAKPWLKPTAESTWAPAIRDALDAVR